MTNVEITILRLPSCSGDNPTNPFLMSIKELPQIRESITKKVHFKCSERIELLCFAKLRQLNLIWSELLLLL